MIIVTAAMTCEEYERKIWKEDVCNIKRRRRLYQKKKSWPMFLMF